MIPEEKIQGTERILWCAVLLSCLSTAILLRLAYKYTFRSVVDDNHAFTLASDYSGQQKLCNSLKIDQGSYKNDDLDEKLGQLLSQIINTRSFLVETKDKTQFELWLEHRHATRIQTYWRMTAATRVVQKKIIAVHKIQKFARQRQRQALGDQNDPHSERSTENQTCSIVPLQRVGRGYLARRTSKARIRALIRLQSFWRMHLVLSLLRSKEFKKNDDEQTRIVQSKLFHKNRMAAIRIQAGARGIVERRRYKEQVRVLGDDTRKFSSLQQTSAIEIQHVTRGWLERIRYENKRVSIIYVQAIIRSHQVYALHKKKKSDIVVLQCFVRSKIAKMEVIRLLQYEKATKIQNYWRMLAATIALKEQRFVAVKIQSLVRRNIQIDNYKKLRTTFAEQRSEALDIVDIPTNSVVEPDIQPSSASENVLPESVPCNKDAQVPVLSSEQIRIQSNVAWLSNKASGAFTAKDYRGAVLKFTVALKIHKDECMSEAMNNDLHEYPPLPTVDYQCASMLLKRSAALLVLGACDAAARDCEAALEIIPEVSSMLDHVEQDVFLESKVLSQLGWAFLKTGKLEEALDAFDCSVKTARLASEQLDMEHRALGHKFVDGMVNDIALATAALKQCQEAMQCLNQFEQILGSKLPAKEIIFECLSQVNIALKVASNDINLNKKKVGLLVALKQWRHVSSHIERVAVERSKLVGAFAESLADSDPYPGLIPPKYLTANIFDVKSGEDPIENERLMLGPDAVGEAVLLLPFSLLPMYLRALRLEERFLDANAGICSLQAQHVEDAWLSTEEDKLKRTRISKHKGDAFFYGGYYERADVEYAACLEIDREGHSDSDSDSDSIGGGKLSAVVHCSRAECLIQMAQYKAAMKECKAALKIHPKYMKAMLSKSRCYAHLEKWKDAILLYVRWLKLAQSASKETMDIDAACLFGGPSEVSDDEVEKVKQELKNTIKSKDNKVCDPDPPPRTQPNSPENKPYHKHTLEQNRTPEQKKTQYCKEKENSSDDPYGFGATAKERREQWRPSPARPTPNSKSTRTKKAYSMYDKEQQESPQRRKPFKKHRQSQNGDYHQDQNNSSRRDTTCSADEDNHYTVLQVSRNATADEIKKGYRMMALQYHPDKNKDSGAVDHFRCIQQAYEVLADDRARRIYNCEIW